MKLIKSSLDNLKSENSSKQFVLENRNITKLFNFFYKIPYYQRPYDWELEDISKFVEDIFEQTIDYLSVLSDGNNDPKKLKHKFIGTIVIAPSRNKPAIKQSGTFFDIVDGQQRITTLQLMLTQLHKILVEHSIILNDHDLNQRVDPSNKANQILHTYKIKLGEINKAVLKTLYASSDEQPLGALVSFMPRIIREDKDKWGIQITDSDYQLSYKSGSSLLLFEYLHTNQSLMDIDFIVDESRDKTVEEYIEENKNKEFNTVESKTKNIYKLIKKLIKDKSNEDVNCELVKEVKSELSQSFEDEKILAELCETYILLSFSLYLINKVSTVVVEATNESEAFDIFDSLNTTGEPLNAIQVLNALVVAHEITTTSEEKYEISRSKKIMDEINSFVNSIDNLANRNSLILDLLKSTKVSLTGTGLNGTQLSHQIKFIKDLYNGKYHTSKDTSEIRLDVLEDLFKTVKFYRDVWKGSELPSNPFEHNLNVNYLTANNHTIVTPLLSYFYNEYKDSKAIFIEVLDAVVSFSVLWRVVNNGTSGIDSFYKNLFSIDSGLLSSVNIFNNKVTVSQIKTELYSKLTENIIDINNEKLIDNFIRKSQNNEFYDLGKTARYFLLAALEDSIPNHEDGSSYLKCTGERKSRKTIFDYETWKNTEIEHIAPESNQNGWDESIYINPNVRNYIGNTTVLPKSENIELSNDSFTNKIKLYELYSTESKDRFNSLLKILITTGVLKDKGTVNINHIRTVSHLSKLDKWDENSIHHMSRELLALGWEFLIAIIDPN